MAKGREKIEIHIVPAKAFEIKPKHKYLMIMPKDAQLTQFAKAFKEFAPDSPIFILAVNDISEIKIAELIEGKENG